MISQFYGRYSKTLLWMAALSLPFLMRLADSLPTNNNVETWLPGNSEVRRTYNAFKRDFGAEEVILIGVAETAADDRVIEAVCRRIDELPGTRQCLSPARLQSVMQSFGVTPEQGDARLSGFLLSDQADATKSLTGLVVLLSPEGLRDRAALVRQIDQILDYSQVRGEDVHLAGAPVVVAEMDRLGNPESNKQFFLITLMVSWCLLYLTIRQWKPCLAILGSTVWAINLTLAVVQLAGGERNFILGALPIHGDGLHDGDLHPSDSLLSIVGRSTRPAGSRCGDGLEAVPTGHLDHSHRLSLTDGQRHQSGQAVWLRGCGRLGDFTVHGTRTDTGHSESLAASQSADQSADGTIRVGRALDPGS